MENLTDDDLENSSADVSDSESKILMIKQNLMMRKIMMNLTNNLLKANDETRIIS